LQDRRGKMRVFSQNFKKAGSKFLKTGKHGSPTPECAHAFLLSPAYTVHAERVIRVEASTSGRYPCGRGDFSIGEAGTCGRVALGRVGSRGLIACKINNLRISQRFCKSAETFSRRAPSATRPSLRSWLLVTRYWLLVSPPPPNPSWRLS